MVLSQEERELAIYAQPLSSDDEAYTSRRDESLDALATKSAPKSKGKRADSARTASSRPKRRKLHDEEGAVLGIQDASSMPDPFEWSSSSSQKRRQPKTYAGRNFQKLESLPSSQRKIPEDEPGFVKFDDVKPPKKSVSQDRLQTLPPVEARKTRAARAAPNKLDVAEVSRKQVSKQDSLFRVPDLPAFPSPSTTAATENLSVFDGVPSKPRKGRSGSTSSLSSLDELEALELEQEQKYINPANGQSSCLRRCTICKQSVKDSATLFVPDDLHKKPLAEQRNFCRKHQESEARDLWEREGWPEINWDELETRRLPEQVPLLKDVLSRKRSSFYLERLDREIAEAKGNRGALRAYLNEGVVDIARQGYYGPKGFHLMGGVVMECLAAVLKSALKSDTAVRAVGVGAYVNTVLVPELTVRLALEDMGLENEKQARALLEESTPAGVLLCPDDDHVEQGDADAD